MRRRKAKRPPRATRERAIAEEIRKELEACTDPGKRLEIFKRLDAINIRIVRLEDPRSGHFGGR